ncbi:MAG: hypothetical protein IT308_08800 [Anaerolineaceae bacterium]|nr:hypothetical protein [Anaerolineaceae bacterium]
MEMEPCAGPLCPLRALYGEETGRELFDWLQERVAGISVLPPELGQALSERDYFLVVPSRSPQLALDQTVPDRDAPHTGLHLQAQNPTLPLGVDWQKAALLAKRTSVMVSFPLYAYSPLDYRQAVEELLAAGQHGVSWLRLEAHPPGDAFLSRIEAHGFVQLVRRTLDIAAPHIRLAAGENAAQELNFSFFGAGGEADLIENLALAPLLLDALETGSARILTEWAGGLKLPYPGLTFYNTLRLDRDSAFDNAVGVLPAAEITRWNGRLSGKRGFIGALANLPGSEHFDTLQAVLRAAQAVLLSLTGLPGFELSHLPGGRVLRERTSCHAFHPHGAQLILPGENPAVFSLLRIAPDGRRVVLCLQNFSTMTQDAHPDLSALGLPGGVWRDLLTGETIELTHRPQVLLKSYQSRWLIPTD